MMEILELDENFQPNTELGKAMKMMVENGDHCDGNIFWLIQLLEQKQEKIESLQKRLNAKITLINNGREVEQYVLQDKVERLEDSLNVALYELEILWKKVNPTAHSSIDSHFKRIVDYLKSKEVIMDRTFFVVIEGNAPIVVTVKDDVNRPKNIDCHTVLERWVTGKYNFKPYDYWEIDTCEKHNI